MLRELIAWPSHNRFWQSVAIALAAIAQIVTAGLPGWLHLGQSVATRSLLASHPLVPLGPAFAIWGLIYAWMLVAAIWQAWPSQRFNRALEDAGWNMAGIMLINAIWQVWVPINGFDWLSSVLVASALCLGVSGLMRLRANDMLSRMDSLLVFAPLALVTGWLTCACVVNFTSELVANGYDLNPVRTGVSLGFLLALIAFGGVIVYVTESVAYSAALVWGLSWVALGNIYRDHEPAMVTTAVIGIMAVAVTCVFALTHRHHGDPMQLRGS